MGGVGCGARRPGSVRGPALATDGSGHLNADCKPKPVDNIQPV